MNRRNFIKAVAALAVVGPAFKAAPNIINPPIPPFIHEGATFQINPAWVSAPYELGFATADGVRYVGAWPPRFPDLESAKYWFKVATKVSKSQAITLENRLGGCH